MIHIDVSSSALKTNLANLNTEVDKIDVDKLKTVPDDLAKLSNVVDNDVVKKTVYNKLVTKVNNIDTTGFVSKTKYDTDKSDLEKKISDAEKRIPNTSAFVKTRITQGFTQGLEHATLYAEKVYPINFTAAKKKLCLSLHFNGDNSYLFANGTDY